MPKLTGFNAEDRFNFLLSLIGYLARRGVVTIEEAATHFDVEPEYVRRAVMSVNDAGLQQNDYAHYHFLIDVDLADEGLLSLIENDIVDDVPRLSTRQSAAMAAGLGYLATMAAFSEDKELAELQSLLSQGTGRGAVSTIEVRPGTADANAEVIRKALVAGKRISCEYVNTKDERSVREIDPLRIDPRSDGSYLRGYCLINKELRNFKLDRMRAVEVLDRNIGIEAKAVGDIEDSLYVSEATDTEVTVDLAPEAYGLISEFQAVLEPKDAGRGIIRAVINVGHLPNIGRLISRYGGAAVVVDPPEARRLVKQYALRALGERTSETLPLEDQD
jgi:proteasome accessory factor C